MNIYDLKCEINAIKTLQNIRADIDEDLKRSREKNKDNNFLYDYDFYQQRQENLNFIISDYVEKISDKANKLLESDERNGITTVR